MCDKIDDTPVEAGGGSPDGEQHNDKNGSTGGVTYSPREALKNMRASIKNTIYLSTGAFSPEILDCMAGKESAWNSSADNNRGFRGLFQFGAAAWADAWSGVSDAPTYLEGVFDPVLSTAAASSYLDLLLIRVVGKDNWATGNFGAQDIRTVIERYNGETTKAQYATQVLDCAQKMKAGYLDAALAAIGK